MGPFQVEASLIGPTGRREEISLLVDTGATFVVISSEHRRPTERPANTRLFLAVGGRSQGDMAAGRGAATTRRPRGDDTASDWA
jgi:hypothetical protein